MLSICSGHIKESENQTAAPQPISPHVIFRSDMMGPYEMGGASIYRNRPIPLDAISAEITLFCYPYCYP